MALFFDQTWFDAKLAATGASRDDIGRLLRLSPEQVTELWKDQRELLVDDVLALSRFLNVPPEEIAMRAGISTPIPKDSKDVHQKLDGLDARIERIEKLLIEMKTLFMKTTR